MKKTVKIEFDEDLFAKLAVFANKNHTSVSRFVALAVQDRLALLDAKGSDIESKSRPDQE